MASNLRNKYDIADRAINVPASAVTDCGDSGIIPKPNKRESIRLGPGNKICLPKLKEALTEDEELSLPALYRLENVLDAESLPNPIRGIEKSPKRNETSLPKIREDWLPKSGTPLVDQYTSAIDIEPIRDGKTSSDYKLRNKKKVKSVGGKVPVPGKVKSTPIWIKGSHAEDDDLQDMTRTAEMYVRALDFESSELTLSSVSSEEHVPLPVNEHDYRLTPKGSRPVNEHDYRLTPKGSRPVNEHDYRLTPKGCPVVYTNVGSNADDEASDDEDVSSRANHRYVKASPLSRKRQREQKERKTRYAAYFDSDSDYIDVETI